MKKILDEFRQELTELFPLEPPRSPTDGLFTKEFFVKFHVILYRYRKTGSEIISEANFQERIVYLRQAEAILKENVDNNDELKATETELRKKYHEVLKGETEDLDKFVERLQEHLFDFFNMIRKEYYMSLDKWATDNDYVKQVKDEYAKVDKELYEDEMNIEVP